MKKLLLMISILICAGLQAQAQSGGSSETSPMRSGRLMPSGFAGFAEISSGYTANNDDIAVEGSPSSVKLLGSYYTEGERGVFDLGAGTHTQHFIKTGALEENTTTAVMEAAARYQFGNRWQLGVVYNQFFDRGANYGANQADAEFGGLQLIKEMTVGTDTHLRLGLRAMRDINNDNQDVDMAQVDVAIGYNPSF